MTPELQLIFGTTMLAAGLSYAWWVGFRVWMLRQDLFSIRDELWDAMKARDSLDEPAHRAMRASLKAFVRVAPLLSVFTLLGILAEGASSHHVDEPSDFPEIEAARHKTVSRVMNYLFFETLMGLAIVVGVSVICLLILTPFRIVKTAFSRWVELVMDSTELIAMGALVSQTRVGTTRQA